MMKDPSSSQNRVLFCRSNPIDPDPRVEKEARSLHNAGYNVTIIAWDRTAILPAREEHDGINLYRLPVRSGYARGLQNIFPLVRWEMKLLFWLIRQRKEYDLIHACDFDTILPALIMKVLYGKMVVYDIFDFYADHLRATPGWIKRLIRFVDLRVMGWADAVVLVDESRKEQIQGARPQHLEVIYNTPREIGAQLKREKSGQSSKLDIIYVGLLQVERGLFELLEVVRGHPEWHLDLAGFGGDEEQIRAQARNLSNVTWHGRISYENTLQLTARCDVSVATYDPGIANHRYASPNKIFEAMMFAKPVVVANRTNMDDIIRRWNCGVVVEYGNVEVLEKELLGLAKDPDRRKDLGKNGRRAYEKAYSWQKMENRLLELYEKVLHG